MTSKIAVQNCAPVKNKVLVPVQRMLQAVKSKLFPDSCDNSAWDSPSPRNSVVAVPPTTKAIKQKKQKSSFSRGFLDLLQIQQGGESNNNNDDSKSSRLKKRPNRTVPRTIPPVPAAAVQVEKKAIMRIGTEEDGTFHYMCTTF